MFYRNCQWRPKSALSTAWRWRHRCDRLRFLTLCPLTSPKCAPHSHWPSRVCVVDLRRNRARIRPSCSLAVSTGVLAFEPGLKKINLDFFLILKFSKTNLETSHRWTSLSSPPVASVYPSGENWTSHTSPWCAANSLIFFVGGEDRGA